jgi:hypothetical protein
MSLHDLHDDHRARYRWLLLHSYITLSSPKLRPISNQTKPLIGLDTSLSDQWIINVSEI